MVKLVVQDIAQRQKQDGDKEVIEMSIAQRIEQGLHRVEIDLTQALHLRRERARGA